MFKIWNSRVVITFVRSSNTSVISQQSSGTNLVNKRFISSSPRRGAATQSRKFNSFKMFRNPNKLHNYVNFIRMYNCLQLIFMPNRDFTVSLLHEIRKYLLSHRYF